jgi:ribosome-binding protein aMBF1 (putative translation factor)
MLKLTVERETRDWSRTELGRRARIHPARVGQAERGRVVPYPVELARLAKALGWAGDPAALLDEVGHGE